MPGNPQIIVEYVANTAKLKAAGSEVSSTSGKVAGAARKAFVPALAVLGVVGAIGAKSVKAAQESEVATNRLEQIFRSMGDTSGKAAKDAEKYASKLSSQIGVEDEAIMASQALIATFGKVSDATARGAGIFDRTTAAAADLSAAGFGPMESNAKALAKALNDPAKGLAKLTKQGVTFTEQEEKKIKALQASGKMTEAQNVLLKAVEKQVGGTAAATATGTEKMAVAFGEAEESAGKALLPLIEKLVPLLTRLGNWMAANPKIVMGLVIALAALAAAIVLVNIALAITAAVTSPITLIIIAIIAAIAALVVIGILLYKNWDTITAKLAAAWGKIKAAAMSVLNWLKANWPLILGILAGPLALAIVLVIRNWDKIKEAIRSAVDAVGGILRRLAKLFDLPADAARAAADAVKKALNGLLDFLGGLVGRAKSAMGKVADALTKPINTVLSAWNRISLSIPSVTIPSVKIGPKKFGGGKIGGQTINFPDVPLLARGGIVTAPTLAMIGEAGPEAVVPLGRLGGPLVSIETLIIREEMDAARIAARLSAAVAVRT